MIASPLAIIHTNKTTEIHIDCGCNFTVRALRSTFKMGIASSLQSITEQTNAKQARHFTYGLALLHEIKFYLCAEYAWQSQGLACMIVM